MNWLHENQKVQAKKESYFEYKQSEYVIVMVFRNLVYGIKNGTLYRGAAATTKDTIEDIDWVATSITNIPDTAIRLTGGVAFSPSIVVIVTGGNIYKATDGLNFSIVQSDVAGCQIQGICTNMNQRIVYAEYDRDDDPKKRRIWYSGDRGDTWSIAYDAENEIRHFHSADYLGTNHFLVTSGDQNSETHWYWSTGGDNWTKSKSATGHQIYRTLGATAVRLSQSISGSYSDNWGTEIVFAGDSNIDGQGIFKAVRGEEGYPQRLLDLPGRALAVTGWQNEILVGVLGQSENNQNQQPIKGWLYLSKDGGKTWQVDAEYLCNTSTWDITAGLRGIVGPDMNGGYWFNVRDFKDADPGNITGFYAKPKNKYIGNIKSLPPKDYKQKTFIYDDVQLSAGATSTISHERLGSEISLAKMGYRSFNVTVIPTSDHNYRMRIRWYAERNLNRQGRDNDIGIIRIDTIITSNEATISDRIEPVGLPLLNMANDSGEEQTYKVVVTLYK